jgi:predicted nucleotide-binding protein
MKAHPKKAQPKKAQLPVYPMIPLRDVVCFPGIRARFIVGRDYSVQALENALETNQDLFTVKQEDFTVETPSRRDLCKVGTIVKVITATKRENEQYDLTVMGLERASVERVATGKRFLLATVRPLPVVPDKGKPLTKIMLRIGTLLGEFLPTIGAYSRRVIVSELEQSNPSPWKLSDTIAAWFPISTDDKQVLLETPSAYDRLQKIANLLEGKDDILLRDTIDLREKGERQENERSSIENSCVFIGHGRSPLWARLQIFLEKELGLITVSYESESRVGNSIVPVLEGMLDQGRFAVLILTSEDETGSGSRRARQNVVHEAGLFQGRLGFRKAVLLIQEGVEDFSNVDGLQHIPFAGDRIDQTFYELQRVLKREGLIQ